MIRRIHMPDLAEPIDEQLLSMNAATLTMRYAIPRGLPVPLDNYTAQARLEPVSDSLTRIVWEGEFTPRGISEADAEAIITGLYDQLIGWLIDGTAA